MLSILELLPGISLNASLSVFKVELIKFLSRVLFDSRFDVSNDVVIIRQVGVVLRQPQHLQCCIGIQRPMDMVVLSRILGPVEVRREPSVQYRLSLIQIRV